MVVNAGVSTLQDFLLRLENKGIGFAQLAALCGSQVALDANRLAAVLDAALHRGPVKTDDHAGEIVSTETGQGVIDENLGGGLRILDVADEVDSFLVGADVPEL